MTKFSVTPGACPRAGAFSPSRHVCAALCMVLGLLPAPSVFAFGLDQVDAVARTLAKRDYAPPATTPEALSQVDADTFGQIRYKHGSRLDWGGSPFSVQPVSAGHVYRHPVELFEVIDDQVHRVPFTKSDFHWPNESFARKVPADLGFAGFGIRYPLQRPDAPETVVRFLGGALFRAVAHEQVMGAHARGLAIDTGLPAGEEFPAFRRFWLVRPDPGARRMTVYALMDSESLTGAYRFVIEPGADQTIIRVKARLHARRPVDRLGLAPISSMYFYGQNERPDASHWRPAVFSSSGLLIHEGEGGWLYRPLRNPRELRLDQFPADGVRGFGLMQRDTRFGSFEDPVGRFEKRPSVWVTPQAGFGGGTLDLVQLPVDSDRHENQVVFFEPHEKLKPGAPIAFAYDVSFGHRDAVTEQIAQVRGVLIGVEGPDKQGGGPSDPAYRVNVDYTGGALSSLPNNAPVVASISGQESVRVLEQSVAPLPEGGWRLSMLLQPTGQQPLKVRASLALDGKTISESWQDTLPGQVASYLEEGK
ncbi:glucan biosynthesis protein [Guyparkeria hydrothermalis]|uniref:glucan biosynthesis protein n=1 Tax=Guyparkeria hydrothermalis TaxID=923 RepID=UPI0020209975|nr:glucan biosynthesis protein [Guyparkeria hydrothermalis]MCL7745308.1 glucan biosynthesis protein [Guyparkeria hydrothermalis]